MEAVFEGLNDAILYYSQINLHIMAFYYSLKKVDPTERRIAKQLLLLKKGIKKSISERTNQSSLLIALNIREFDSAKYRRRSKECLFYIAEIISSSNLVEFQEVNEDLAALKEVMRCL